MPFSFRSNTFVVIVRDSDELCRNGTSLAFQTWPHVVENLFNSCCEMLKGSNVTPISRSLVQQNSAFSNVNLLYDPALLIFSNSELKYLMLEVQDAVMFVFLFVF